MKGLYFLYNDEELIYIGKSNNIKNRISQHLKTDKVFNGYKSIEIDNNSNLSIYELAYIDKYKPIHNKQDKFETIGTLDIKIEDISNIEIIRLKKRKRKQVLSDMMYVENSLDKIINLSKNEAKVFGVMIKTRDDNNIVQLSMSKIVKQSNLEWSRSYTSGRVKKMIELNLISKEGTKIWINPLVIAPKYDQDNPSNAWEVQQLWKLMYDDANAWFEGSEQLEIDMFGKVKEKKYIKVGKGEESKIIETP